MAENMKRSPLAYRKFRADPLLAEGLLAVDRPGGELEARAAAGLFRFAEEQRQIADREVQERFGLAGRQAAVAGAPHVSIEGGGDDVSIAAAILRKEEGFRDAPYWDVNAFRTGYGSDTITRADGTVVKVERGMRISREDAERDLARRLTTEFMPRAASQVGAENWNRLPPHARAALASVAYNYGSLPRTVAAAARSGNIEVLANTVERLSANRERRRREAAIIRGAAPAPAGEATIAASGGGFRPMAGNTLAARAYNEAGARTYLQMLNTELLSTTRQAFDLYGDDPVALERALGALKDEFSRAHVFPEIAADFEVAYGRLAADYMSQARKRLEDRLVAQDRAEFVERTGALRTEIARQIEAADPDLPETAGMLATIQKQIDDHYDAAVDRGILDADDAATAKIKARGEAAAAFYLKQADGRQSAEEIAALREQMRADFSAGELDGVDAEGWGTLEAGLVKLETQRRQEELKKARELEERASVQVTRVEMGFDPDPAEISKLELDQPYAPEGKRIVEAARTRIEVAKRLRDLPLPAAREYVAELRAKTGRDASDAEIATLAYAEERLGKLEKMAADDPVGYEIVSGRLQPVPIALAGSDEELAASLAERRRQMAAVAETYGRPMELFRPGERTALARMMTEDPRHMPRLVKVMRQTLGADAATALAEIAPEAPALAHAAGVSLATGDDGFAEEVADTLAARRRGEFKLKMPAEEKFALAAGPQFSRALGALGRTRAAALQTAQLLFEREANLLGFDPAEIDKEGTPAQAAWQRAINRALGRQIVGGRQQGGLAEINGEAIVAPAGMDIDEPQRLVSGLTDEQLAALPPIWTANGVPVTARQIRAAHFVTAGDGLYRVALGDPAGFEPRWLLAEDGSLWTLDLNALARLPPSTGWLRNQVRRGPGWGILP